jgi:hypothetical protein
VYFSIGTSSTPLRLARIAKSCPWRQLTFTTSSSKKLRNTYGSKRGKRNSTGLTDEIFNGNTTELASPRSSPSPFPPHIHEAVQDATANNAATVSNNRQIRTRSLRHSTSSVGSSSTDGTMANERESSVASAGDADQEPSSSPRSTTTGLRQLELNRSSSPAKRKLEDDHDAHSVNGEEQDSSASKRQKSPKDEEDQITSPLPSRHKPVPSIEVHDEEARNVDMDDSLMEDVAADTEDGVEQVIGHGQTEEIPHLNDQVRMITKLTNEAKLEDGVKTYLVANAWLNRVVSRTTAGRHDNFDKELREGVIGSVDNSSIVANGEPRNG